MNSHHPSTALLASTATTTRNHMARTAGSESPIPGGASVTTSTAISTIPRNRHAEDRARELAAAEHGQRWRQTQRNGCDEPGRQRRHLDEQCPASRRRRPVAPPSQRRLRASSRSSRRRLDRQHERQIERAMRILVPDRLSAEGDSRGAECELAELVHVAAGQRRDACGDDSTRPMWAVAPASRSRPASRCARCLSCDPWLRLQRRDEDLFERQRFDRERFWRARPQLP